MTEDELKQAIRNLPPMAEVEPAHTWEFWRYDLRQNILDNDPKDFLRWPGIVGTMFVGNAPYIDKEVSTLRHRYLRAIDEPQIGSPEIYTIGQTPSSGNLIHQSYHLSQWERATGKRVEDLDSIVEIGGGYGAMCMIVHHLGFKGKYTIIDLPEFSLLQQYYLSHVGVDGVEFVEKVDYHTHCDLLIGLFSLSEIPLDQRNAMLAPILWCSHLIALQGSWGGVNNLEWAEDLMDSKKLKGALFHNHNPPVISILHNIGHLPNCYYLLGNNEEIVIEGWQ